MEKISIIIPIFNEEENIDHLVYEVGSFFQKETRFTTEIIFVNDGSTDDSLSRLKKAHHHSYTYKIISFSRNFGSHAALRAGIQKAQGDYITFIYADLQDPLTLVIQLYNEMKNKAVDITWAFRNSTAATKWEKFFSSAYASLMRKYAVSNFPKKGFDVVMFSTKIKACLDQNVESNSSIFIQILNLGFKQANIIYDKNERLLGTSKWTISKKIKLFIDSFVAFSFAPIRLVSVIGIIFFLLGILWTGYIIIRTIIFNDLAMGWPALLSILMIGFGITNISLGIIAEYLWRTLDASRKRPVFVIDEIVGEVTQEKSVQEYLSISNK
ncbi:glycosyltransferase [Gillisia limnaea]|uniref:Glycosyl transferase family 2 n=1 Tax=Gillisia limnaea (strain DSM 15749 / LMG 21470 / R-8282) TaxID=865937 RepID=H2BT69_GILLR|nr:glycosyltransferase [Gillisia limnaea]EHQ02627.1 glycosyl transferase family 2 [Gillisia limnaea DSM 15749]